MTIGLFCPISGEVIKDPVVYKGYIYDEKSIQQLIRNGKVNKDDVYHDYFVRDIIRYIEAQSSTLVPLEQLAEIYSCSFSHDFPRKAILCLKDGRSYDEEYYIKYIESLPETNQNQGISSFFTRKRINSDDLIYHPLHIFLSKKIELAIKAKQTLINFDNLFKDFIQPRPIFVQIYKPDINYYALCMILFHSSVSIFEPLIETFSPFSKFVLFLSETAFLTMTAHNTYSNFLLTNIIDYLTQPDFLKRQTQYLDSKGNSKTLSDVKKFLVYSTLTSTLLLPHIVNFWIAYSYNNSKYNDHDYHIQRLYRQFLMKDLRIFYFPIAQSYFVLRALKTENITKNCYQYLIELIDQKAPRNYGKSKIKLTVEAITTLALLGSLFPLALGGLYAVSDTSSFGDDQYNILGWTNFILNLPLVLYSTTSIIETIRTSLFSRADQYSSTPYGSSIKDKIISSTSIAARAICSVAAGGLFQYKGSFFAAGIGLNALSAPALHDYIEEDKINKLTGGGPLQITNNQRNN